MTTARVALRGIHAAMAALFAYAVFVQHDDVDPWTWVPVYAAAAVLSGLAAAERFAPRTSLALSVVSLAWGLGWTTTVDFGRSFDVNEEAREALGLLLVALWAGVIGVQGRRAWRTRPARSPSSGGSLA